MLSKHILHKLKIRLRHVISCLTVVVVPSVIALALRSDVTGVSLPSALAFARPFASEVRLANAVAGALGGATLGKNNHSITIRNQGITACYI